MANKNYSQLNPALTPLDGTELVTLWQGGVTVRTPLTRLSDLYVPKSTGGTVTSVSVVTANGVSGSVATSTTTPAVTLTLGNITPSRVNGNAITTGTGTLTLSTFTLTVTGAGSVSGVNTGDQDLSAYLTSATAAVTYVPQTRTVNGQPLSSDVTVTSVSGNAGTATALAAGRTISITGDLAYTSPAFNGTGNVTAAGTLANVNGNVGSFTNASVTVNAKGLVTAVSSGAGVGSVTGVSVVSAHGFAGTVATSTTTPAITISTTVTGIPVGDGTSFSASVVTNDVQTKAAVVPNTAPAAGQVLVGNAGGTAYAPQSVASPFALSSAGALTVVADVPFATHKVTGLGDPTGTQDAATKNYVDGLVNGLSWKDPVRAATAAPGTLATSFANGQTVDTSVVLVTGDRIAIKDQADPKENGLYVVAASGAPSRTSDAGSGALLLNAAFFVAEGTANHDTQWVGTADSPITVGVTPLPFVQIGAGAVYSADGTTLTLTGSVFSVSAGYAGQASITTLGTVAAGTWAGTTVAVNHGGSGATTFTAHGVLLGEGASAFGVTAAMSDGQLLVGQGGADPLPKSVSGDVTMAASGAVTIAANAVTTTKINNAAVTYAKVQNVGASTLLGNPTGSPAAPSEVTLGAGLSFSGTTIVSTGGGGTVLGVSVATANGFAGTSSGGTTPALTLSTTVTGILQGNGTTVSAATISSNLGFSAGTLGSALGTAAALGDPITAAHGGTGVNTSGATGVAHVSAGTWSVSTVVESDITLAGNTTNNVTAGRHGFVPALPNDATKYFDGTGAYSVPPGTGGTVTTVSVVTANGFAGAVATATTTPAITLTTTVTGVPVGNGTSFSASSVTNDAQTKAAVVPNTAPSAGQVLVGNAGGTAYAPVTLSGSGATFTLSSAGVLTVSGIATGSITGLATIATSGSVTDATGTLLVTHGGTGLATLTAHSLYAGNGASAPTALGAATNGQLPIGSTGADPALAALTGTANQITVTNGSGSITLSIPSGPTLPGTTRSDSHYGTITTDTPGSTITFDMSASNLHTVTLGAGSGAGNSTLAVSNVNVGQTFLLRLVQDGGGSRTVTWFTTLKWPGGTVPTLTAAAGKTDVFSFLCTSAGNYDAFVVGQNL